MRVGVLLIQTLSTEEGGISKALVSIAGSSTYAIDSQSEIPREVLLISNLDQASLAKMKLGPWVKPDDFFGVKIEQIISDLRESIGAKDERVLNEVCVCLQNMVTFYFSAQGLDLCGADGSAYRLIQHHRLDEDGSAAGQMDGFLLRWVAGSVQASTNCSGKIASYDRRLIIKRDPLLHLLEVLDTPLPTGRYKYYGQNDLMGDHHALIERLCNLNQLFIVKIKGVRSVNPMSSIFGFGRTFGRLSPGGGGRSYITNYEFAVMSKLYQFQIEEVVIFETDRSSISKNHHLALINEVPRRLSHAYSGGLVYFNLLKAFLEKWWVPSAEGVGDRYSLSTVFYSARDRMLSFLMAAELATKDVSIHSYRNGYVFCEPTESSLPMIDRLSREKNWVRS